MLTNGWGKAAFAALGAVLVVVSSAFTDNAVTTDEKVAIGIAIVNAVLVYIVPNLSTGVAEYAKSIGAGLLAVLTGLTGLLVDGMSYGDWINLLIAFGAAAGIFLAPAAKHPANA